jgi:hypothetical protein
MKKSTELDRLQAQLHASENGTEELRKKVASLEASVVESGKVDRRGAMSTMAKSAWLAPVVVTMKLPGQNVAAQAASSPTPPTVP